MTKPSQGSSEINDIVREQIQLVKTERELTALIDKVNDQINQLLVEELQMKSCLIGQNQTYKTEPSTSYQNPKVKFDSASTINEQNLELLSADNNQSMEEYDD